MSLKPNVTYNQEQVWVCLACGEQVKYNPKQETTKAARLRHSWLHYWMKNIERHPDIAAWDFDMSRYYV